MTLLALCLAMALSACTLLKDKGYYEMGKDRITSIGGAVGERKMIGIDASINNGMQTNTYKYQTDPNDETQAANDVYNYLVYLRENDGFLMAVDIPDFPYAGGIEVQAIKESADEGKVIVLDIDYNTKGYTLVFAKYEDTIVYYDE